MDNTQNASFEAEMKHCAEDFVYFCETYVKITHPLRGLIPFELFDYQKRYVKALNEHRFLATVKFRQGGFTSITLVWLLWRFLFKLDESNMVMSKTDMEAISCNHILRNVISQLPDFLQPKMSKCNDHTLHAEDTNNRLYFHTPEAARGRALNYLFIDESAFIKDMDMHWKALYPTLSTGGHCITVSTPNGANGWFYQTVKDARERKNSFFLFTAEYHEHPDYDCDQWVAQAKKNLGLRGFRQEVLCEFLDPMNLDDRYNQGIDFLVEVTAAEEQTFLAERKKKFKEEHGSKDLFIKRKIAASKKRQKEEGWDVFHNNQRQKLVFEDCDYDVKQHEEYSRLGLDLDEDDECSKPFSQWVYKDTTVDLGPLSYRDKETLKQNLLKPEVIQFEQLTREQIRDKYKKDLESYDPSKVKHPEFADPKAYSTVEELAELFSDLWGDDSWAKRLKKQQRENKRMQDRIDSSVDPEMMALCGLISNAEAASMVSTRPDLKILEKLTTEGDLPDNINLEFFDGFLCVNEVPTIIKEDDIRDAYNGHLSLTSEREAIDTVVKLVKCKLTPLFGVAKETVETIDV